MTWREDLEDLKNNPFIFDDPILGVRETAPDPRTQQVTGETSQSTPILQSQIISRIPNELNPNAQLRLALEMFLNIDSAYSDLDEVLDEDGTVNQESFMSALQTTLQLAATAGPMGFNTTPKYLNILTGASSTLGANNEKLSIEELLSKAASEESNKAFPFSGLVINEMLDQGLSNVLGRGASKSEQKAFTEIILKMGDSVATTDLRLEAEQFGRMTKPAEAKGFSMVEAAGSVMKVLGLG
jgi:hypothetical protein